MLEYFVADCTSNNALNCNGHYAGLAFCTQQLPPKTLHNGRQRRRLNFNRMPEIHCLQLNVDAFFTLASVCIAFCYSFSLSRSNSMNKSVHVNAKKENAIGKAKHDQKW